MQQYLNHNHNQYHNYPQSKAAQKAHLQQQLPVLLKQRNKVNLMSSINYKLIKKLMLLITQ
jgi:hypothetical protein